MNLTKELSECLFKEAKEFAKFSKWLSYIILLLILISMFINGKALYIISIIIFLKTFFLIFTESKAKNAISLAKKAHQLEFVYFLCGSIKVYKFLADISATLSIKTLEWLKKNKENIQGSSYTSPHEINKLKKMLWMIQENAFWNTNLYSKAFQDIVKNIVIISLIVFIGISLIIAVPNNWAYSISIGILDISTDTYQIIRIGLLILSSTIILNKIQDAILFNKGSKKMRKIVEQISNINTIEHDEFLEIFTEYHSIKEVTPMIPYRIYEDNQENLNKSWGIMSNQFTKSDQNETIRACTNLISNLVNSSDYKWMLIGSASLSLQGITLDVNDIDILTDEDGIDLIKEKCKPFIIEEIGYKEIDNLKSYYGKLNISGVNIDIVSEIKNNVNNEWLPQNKIEEEIIRNSNINLRNICYEKQIYERIGDTKKAELINKKIGG